MTDRAVMRAELDLASNALRPGMNTTYLESFDAEHSGSLRE